MQMIIIFLVSCTFGFQFMETFADFIVDQKFDVLDTKVLLDCNTWRDCPSWASRAQCVPKFNPRPSEKSGYCAPLYCGSCNDNCPNIGDYCSGGVISGKCNSIDTHCKYDSEVVIHDNPSCGTSSFEFLVVQNVVPYKDCCQILILVS